VAAVVCCSSAVAGEMLQDLKVGHILGGTPWRMQTGNLIGAVVAGGVMYFPLLVLHVANKQTGGIGFGDKALSAPQAGLMAALSKGIVGGEMAWPLVVVGMLMGVALILVRVKSPMLFAVGMYLPLETTAAIFIGGLFRWCTDRLAARRRLNEAQQARVENAGVLVASGLIAGEALMGLVVAAYVFFTLSDFPAFSWDPSMLVSIFFVALIALYLIWVPLRRAGAADEPPPPSGMV
jgi:putative OPT family oligopeptide transporter